MNVLSSHSWHSRVIVLTGTIGSGKSLAAKFFRELGAYTLDADQVSREAVANGSPGLAQISKAFGNIILTEDGRLDRKKLAKLVFADREKRKALEAIIHPIIRKLAETHFRKAFAQSHPLYIYECPLFFEAGLDKMPFKKIIVVKATDDLCQARIIKREGITTEEASQRISAQFPPAIKEQRADIIIENSSTETALRERVTEVFYLLTSRR